MILADRHEAKNGVGARDVDANRACRLTIEPEKKGMIPRRMLIGMRGVIHTDPASPLEENRPPQIVVSVPFGVGEWLAQHIAVGLVRDLDRYEMKLGRDTLHGDLATSAANGSATRLTEGEDAGAVERGAEHGEDWALRRAEVNRTHAVELSKRRSQGDP